MYLMVMELGILVGLTTMRVGGVFLILLPAFLDPFPTTGLPPPAMI